MDQQAGITPYIPNLPPPYFAQCKKLEVASLGMMLEYKLHKHNSTFAVISTGVDWQK